MKRFLCIFIFLTGIQISFSQDVHWSQFDHNPVFQNPGNVGQFDGTYRFHALYRDQWRSVTRPFQTFVLSGEAKQLYKNINFGVYLLGDRAGDGKYATVELLPSLSYTLKLTSDSTHLLRPGVQFGLNFRSLNPSDFYFNDQFNGQQFDQNLPSNEDFDRTSQANFNFGMGFVYEYQKDKRHRITAGIGLFNINRPKQGFFTDEIRRNRRFNLFVRAEQQIGFDWDLLPSIQLNLQGVYRELVLGSQVRYILKDRLGEYRAVLAGIYMRSSDAVFITAGLEYQNWRAGISYDINYSDLTPASQFRGGLELSLRYILFKFNPRKVIHRICPDYI